MSPGEVLALRSKTRPSRIWFSVVSQTTPVGGDDKASRIFISGAADRRGGSHCVFISQPNLRSQAAPTPDVPVCVIERGPVQSPSLSRGISSIKRPLSEVRDLLISLLAIFLRQRCADTLEARCNVRTRLFGSWPYRQVPTRTRSRLRIRAPEPTRTGVSTRANSAWPYLKMRNPRLITTLNPNESQRGLRDPAIPHGVSILT